MNGAADVLIVGAGPTGLMLANQLGRRGVRARIIDRHTGPSLQTRALGVQARTLEIYAHLDIVEHALDLGKRAAGANIWVQGRRAARLPVGDIGRGLSPYPFLLILGQDDNERELSGIAFEGAPYEHVFFVADIRVTGPMVPDEINVYLWRAGFHLFFPMRGTDHWRLVGILPPHLRGRDDLTFEEVIPSVRQQAGTELSFEECSWLSTYRIHHRRAARFSDRRCFLLGDAAHIHSPVGGQGMNTGLQDAYNLAWKLALVVSRRAAADLLDSYEDERLPVAERLLSTTDRAFSLVVADSWLAGLFLTRLLPKILAFVMGLRRFQKLAFRTISQTGIRYRSSLLSETLAGLPEAAPKAGDRFPWLRLKFRPNGPTEDLFGKLDDTRFNLTVVGQTSPPGGVSELGEMVRIHEVPSDPANDRELARAHVPQPSFYLLRPDGHVALAGTRWDAAAATRYVSARLHFGG